MADDYIAMKMLTRFKEIRHGQPNKRFVDIELMLGLLDVVREYDVEPPNKVDSVCACEEPDKYFIPSPKGFCKKCNLPTKQD